MATQTTTKLATTTDPDPTVKEGNDWPAMKLTVLGIITLACAFAFLYFVSPMGNPP